MFVRATVAHARIRSLRTEAASAAPGVVAVLTARDLTDLPPAPPLMPLMNQAMCRRFWRTTSCVSPAKRSPSSWRETPEQAADAAELVEVEYDALPVLVDPEQAALDRGAAVSVAATNTVSATDDAPRDGLFDGCDVVVEARLVNSRMAVAPIDLGRARRDGRATTSRSGRRRRPPTTRGAGSPRRSASIPTWCASSCPTWGRLRWKLGNYPEDVMVAWLARRLGRPMRWVESRAEHMSNFRTLARRFIAQPLVARTTAILAYRLEVLQDCGAYPSNFGGMMPLRTRMMASGCYAIPTIEYTYRTVVTNTTPMGRSAARVVPRRRRRSSE
jgi:carbon-monoxide dehydrogenase large subunit